MAAWSDKQIELRARAAQDSRRAILPYIKSCLEMTMPWRLDGRSGASAFERLYDSTGPINVQKSASRLQSEFSPTGQRWFELEAGPLVPEDKIELLNRQLMLPTTLAHVSLDASGFPIASVEAYADMLIGTGAILAAEGDARMPIHWSSAPAWQLAIEEGPGHRVDNVFWAKAFEAYLLPSKWPGAQWPKRVQDLINQGSAEKVEVMQASYYDPELQGWRLAIQCQSGGDRLGAQRGSLRTVWDKARDRTNPWIIFRYWTTPGDPWGRGPVMLALPDIRTANKTVEMVLTAAAYALAPPLMVMHDGVVNPDTMSLGPRSLIRVARTGGPMGPSIAPLNLGGNVDVGQIVLEDQRDAIVTALKGRTLPPASGAVRSASEWIQRSQDLQSDFGSAYGRLNHELAPQVVARVLDVLDRMKVSGIDWQGLQVDEFFLKVKVTSPLARGQNLEDAQTVVQFWETAKAVGGEEAFHMVANLEHGLPKLAKIMGVPLWAVNDPETRATLAKAIGKMAVNMLQPANDGQAPPGMVAA